MTRSRNDLIPFWIPVFTGMTVSAGTDDAAAGPVFTGMTMSAGTDDAAAGPVFTGMTMVP